MKYTNELIVYTCSTDNYDNLANLQEPIEGVRFVYFTNKLGKKPKGWDVSPLCSPPRLNNGHDINRFHKLFAHHLFPDYRYSIYLDGNANYCGDITELLKKFKDAKVALAAFKHPAGRNLIEEVDACEFHKKFDDYDRARVAEQLKCYAEEGFVLSQPISANSILIRDHYHPNLKQCVSLWWAQLFEYCKRDQLSLNYVLWKTNTPWTFIDEGLGLNSSYFHRHRHARKNPYQKLKKYLKL